MRDPSDKNELQKKSNSTSVLFGSTFGGKVSQTICADIGADVNLMDEKLFKKISDKEINLKLEKFAKPVLYEMAAEDENGFPAKIKCDKKSLSTWNCTYGMVPP